MEFAEFLENLKSSKKTYKKPEKMGIATKRTENAKAQLTKANEARLKNNKKNNGISPPIEEPIIEPTGPMTKPAEEELQFIKEYIKKKEMKKQRKNQVNELTIEVRKQLQREQQLMEIPPPEEQLYSRHKYDAYIRELNK